MTKKATGVSMNGTMININRGIKPIPCDCSRCRHRVSKGSIKYCNYYDLFSPDKKMCMRYTGSSPNQIGKPKKKKKKVKPQPKVSL